MSVGLQQQFIESFDGTSLFVQQCGPQDGGPVDSTPIVLVHGFATDCERNWIGPGIVDHLVGFGHSVVMFDLRGHGRSDRPIDIDSYCGDAMARDVMAVVNALDITRFHIVGYSLGAIVTARALVLGLRPASAALCGMGDCLLDPHWDRPAKVSRALREGASDEPEVAGFVAFVAASGGDALALSAVQASHRATTIDDWATWSPIPLLVLAGSEDAVNGDPVALARSIPGAIVRRTPGHHLSAMRQPEFAIALADWIAQHD
jgi:pimeloyl-ACP methyl ester carboxylesterase